MSDSSVTPPAAPPSYNTYTRRSFLGGSAASLALLSCPGSMAHAASFEDHPHDPNRPDAAEALRRLIKGNERFAAGKSEQAGRTPADFSKLVANQTPYATIISCADSRVSPELLFDTGIGDLFVIRIAGNYVSSFGSAVTGSIQYGVLEVGTPLIVVLGHSGCGAVKAAIQHIHDHDALPEAIEDLVNNIRPSVVESEKLPGDLLANATRANVRRSVQRLKTMDPVVAPKVKQGTVQVIGGVYDLSTGKMTLI
jgi:carbonic anhydrase